MHFFYIDEAGCNLRDLDNPESPIFTLGGIVVKDKGWNTTHAEFERIISHYFNDQVPDDFELHIQESGAANLPLTSWNSCRSEVIKCFSLPLIRAR